MAGGVWVLALYFLCRPYRGVRHDAQIYFGQAQFHLTPQWMSHDLYFLYGSQDRYSVFSTLFAPLLNAFGLVHAEVGALLFLHALFWIACWCLARRLASPDRWFALAVVALMPHFYGGGLIFSFNEPFLTARVLAEPFCVFALVAFEYKRPGWMAVSLVLALIAHPLIALPVWALIWLLLLQSDRRWWWAGVVLVLAAGAGWLGLPPFDGLFKRFDATWYEHVRDSNGFDFLQVWEKESWSLLLFDLGFLTLASLDANAPFRRLYRAAAIIAVVLLVSTAILVDGFHLVLPTQLQLWRVMWIVHLLALLGLYPVCKMLWRRGPVGQLATAVTVLAAVIVNGQAQTGFVFAIAALLLMAAALRGAALDRRIVVGGIVICVLGALVMGLIQALEMALTILQGIRTGMAAGRLGSIPAAIPELTLALAWLALIGAAGSRRRWCLPLSALVGALALYWGVTQWDQRDDWARYTESHYGQPNPFGASIPPTAQVYWPGEMLANWALLQRANYFSLANSAGAVFNRQATEELFRRKKIVLPMTIQTDACVRLALEGHANYDPNDCKYTDRGIRDVCRTPGAPDDVVLMNALQMPPLAVWNYQPPGRPPEPYYLYDCHRF